MLQALSWIFPELLDQGLDRWPGTIDVYMMGADDPTHAMDVTDSLPTGIESARTHGQQPGPATG